MAWGDLDFSLRAKRAGIPVVVAPRARLFHEVGDYDARVAGRAAARRVRRLDADPMHNLSLSAHAEIWRRHGPRLLWPLSLGAEGYRSSRELSPHPRPLSGRGAG